MNLSISRKRTGWLAFAFCLLIYCLTLCPTVYWDDAGELIAASHTLGVPHPPGHPLYVLAGKVFTLIPLGSVAARVNFMSAFFGALTCLVVCTIIRERLEEHPLREVAALGGAFFFAFAPTTWEQATVAETSTLHSFFMMLLTLLAFRLASGRVFWKSEMHSLCLFGFLYGLSLTNHVAGVFFFPAFAYIFITTYGKRILSPRLLLGMSISCFAGLLLYAYLPIRSLSDPPIDWGNPENLKNFLWVVTAKQYAPNLITKPNIFAVSAHLFLRAKDLLHQFTVVGCALGLVGVWTLGRSEKRVVVFSLLVIGVLLYIGFNTAFISAYFIPAIALMSVWIGAGLHQTFLWVGNLSRRFRPPSVARALRRALCAMLAAGFVLPLGIHFRDMDRSNNLYALRYGEELLDRLPERAALFTVDGHALFILWYLIYCENRRPDLMVIEPTWLSAGSGLRSQVLEQYPDLALPASEHLADCLSGVTDTERRMDLTIQAVLDANYELRPIYWGIVSRELPFSRNLIPQGIVYRYAAEPVTMDEEIVSQNRAFWEAELDLLSRDPAMRRDMLALEIYPVELNNQGLLFEEFGREDLAMWATKLALEFNPEYPVSRYNLARLHARAGRHEEAIQEYRHAVRGNPYMAVAYYGLGNAYKNVGRLDEAFLAYRQATRMYPAYHEALTAMGQLYALVGQNEDAAEKFREALNVEPTYTFALRGLGSAYLEMGRLDEAREALDRALQIEPESAPGLFALAKYYAYIGDEAEAAGTLQRSVEIGGTAFLTEALTDEHLREVAAGLSVGDGGK